MMPQQYCLRWKYHHSNLQTMFSQLLDRGCFCDVTLACEGQTIKAHRVVLCACSTYFDSLLTNCCSEKDPIIIMRDAKFEDVKGLIEFMYKGEINVEHENLASLLKTAEELKIKGLAEVSWKDDNNSMTDDSDGIKKDKKTIKKYSTTTQPAETITQITPTTPPPTTDGQDNELSVAPVLTPVCSSSPKENSSPNIPVKRKRGRPPLDGEFDSYSTPKISHVESHATFANSSHLLSAMMDETSKEKSDSVSWAEQNLDSQMEFDDDEANNMIIPKLERPDTPNEGLNHYRDDDDDGDSSPSSPKSEAGASGSQSVQLTAQELEEWKDVIKMNKYLTKGRRPQFWEETFTKRVMDAIKNKDLEMKKAAQILGVSYGTLYGRYRETYGCLKHPYRGPFMVSRLRDMWGEGGPTGEMLGMLQRGGMTLPRAAELMDTSAGPLNGYLEQSQDYLTTEQSPEDQDDEQTTNKRLSLPNHPEVSLINVKKTVLTTSNSNQNNIERYKNEGKA